MKAARADFGRLSSRLAHELNNPLSIIRVAAYNLRCRTRDPSLAVHLDHIDQKVLESHFLIENMNLYARRVSLSREPVETEDLLVQCVERVRARFPDSRVTVTFGGGSVRLRADRRQITQALINLLDNAFQAFDASGGGIVLKASRTPGNLCRIEVRDNGSGIPSGRLKRVGDAFFTTRTKGLGLGLTVARAVVRRHKGRLKIDSAPGRGTTVHIILPLK